MPKIKTRSGYIRYKTVPLYLGIKRIDKEKSFENLILFKEVMDSQNIEFMLVYGTLLGVIRDHNFISHDEDIDLALMKSDLNRFLDAIPLLQEKGFVIARYDRRGLISLIRQGEYMDMYFYHAKNDDLYTCCGSLLPREFLDRRTEIDFKGAKFLVPKQYNSFLEFEYGENWKTPVQWVNFEQSKMKTSLNEIKFKIKDSLPDWLFYILVPRFEAKQESIYLPKYEEWKKNGKLAKLKNEE